MCRALVWMAVCALLLAAAALIGLHLKPDHNTTGLSMPAPEAALRQDARMAYDWPHGSVDVNAATAAQLEALPMIGPAMARRIIEQREKNGPFFYPQDLLNVDGIGAKTLQKLWPFITLTPIIH